jgi:hypothetical protein
MPSENSVSPKKCITYRSFCEILGNHFNVTVARPIAGPETHLGRTDMSDFQTKWTYISFTDIEADSEVHPETILSVLRRLRIPQESFDQINPD